MYDNIKLLPGSNGSCERASCYKCVISVW